MSPKGSFNNAIKCIKPGQPVHANHLTYQREIEWECTTTSRKVWPFILFSNSKHAMRMDPKKKTRENIPWMGPERNLCQMLRSHTETYTTTTTTTLTVAGKCQTKPPLLHRHIINRTKSHPLRRTIIHTDKRILQRKLPWHEPVWDRSVPFRLLFHRHYSLVIPAESINWHNYLVLFFAEFVFVSKLAFSN